jgi:hypothetical protein
MKIVFSFPTKVTILLVLCLSLTLEVLGQFRTSEISREATISDGRRSARPGLRPSTRQRPISILIEEGAELPPQLLIRLKGSPRSEGGLSPRAIISDSAETVGQIETASPSGTIFTISGGNARFRSGGSLITTARVEGGADESFIRLLVNGQMAVDYLRIATLPQGGIPKLMRHLAGNEAAVITWGDRYAVVDEDKLVSVAEPSLQISIPIPGNEEDSDSDPNNPANLEGLCIRTPRGPGLVRWQISDPAGKGFSVKPEASSVLVWASAPSNEIDAIYNKFWGCGVALKVPDSCTIDWKSSSYTACCNALFAAMGYVPTWVNPKQHSFPDCPLK